MNRPRSFRSTLVLTVLLAVALGVVASTSLAQQTADSTGRAEAGWGQMSAEQRAQAIAYSNTNNVFYFVGFFYGLAVFVVILFTGFSARLLAWAERIGRRRFFILALYIVFLTIILHVATLPLDYYLGYHVEHQYGLSNQSTTAWAVDLLKNLALVAIIGIIVAAIGYALIRHRPRTWWVWFGIASAPFLVFIMVIAPVVITPMFYETKPMEEGALRTQILDLAARSGIPDSRVFVMNASKDTKKINAYVTGLGKTQRIVLYDNTIATLAPAEILFVLGHEMGHYLMHHVWIGLGLAVALIFLFGWLAHLLMGRLIAANKHRFGFDRLSSFASIPLLMLTFSVFGFLFSPILNTVWRHFEHRADVFGLQVTQNSEVAASAFEKLAAANLSNPDPSAFIKFWLYDHPTLSERVRFVRSYVPGSSSGGSGNADSP